MDFEGSTEDRSATLPEQVHLPKEQYQVLVNDLVLLRCSNESLQSKFSAAEETVSELHQERSKILDRVARLEVLFRDASQARNSLAESVSKLEISSKRAKDELSKKVDDEYLKNEALGKETSFLKDQVEKLESALERIGGRNESLLKALNILNPIKDSLVKIVEHVDDEEEDLEEERVDTEELVEKIEDEEAKSAWERMTLVGRLAIEAEIKIKKFKDAKEKEKRELQSSVDSLTEENRDINSLFRVALAEKEAVEKKLKEGNADQKRVALLQIAERGLRGVGFGFMMGSTGGEQQALQDASLWTAPPPNNTVLPATPKDEDHEQDDGSLSLASTVEKIMKNLRAENLQLKRSMEEYRSDNERLHCVAEKQANEVAAKMKYIEELEERERLLRQHIEALAVDLKEAEAEVTRWREACELEVEAGKSELAERDKMISILKKELEKTKGALDISNGKLKLKDDLAEAAMGAQAAAEKSLQQADIRAAGLRERIELLTKQIEEAENRDRNQRRVRHICWPWRFLVNGSTVNTKTTLKTRRLLPDMQALLQ